MKIECFLQRDGGTHVMLGETIYHFAPSKSDPRHIADVTEKAHIQAFLKIDEAYRIADEGDEKPAPKKPVLVTKAAETAAEDDK